MIRGLPEQEYFASGHMACAGCPETIAVRHILKAAGKNTIVVNATSCLEVVSTPYPRTSWRLPYIHNAFGNAAPTASGVHAALKALGKRRNVNLLVLAGDGGTFDIGFGALSGCLERREKFTYVCYNTQAYSNTGYQRSGATPFGAWTTTTPSGKKIFAKPIDKIIQAHDVDYFATASLHDPQDLYKKVKKSFSFNGPSFIHVLAPCVLAWKIDSSQTVEVARKAVETGLWILYEVEKGKVKINVKPKFKPIKEYLKLQGRFKHIKDSDIKIIQDHRDKVWKSLE